MSEDTTKRSNAALIEEAFSFYNGQLKFYRGWAKLHRYGYWLLVFFSVGIGITIAFCLLLKTDAFYVAVFALALNCLLVISKAIGSDRKYPKYRITEIRLAFALQAARNTVAKQIRTGMNLEDAILDACQALHEKVESLVLEEFGEFFREMKSIDEIHKSISEQTNLSAKSK
jgi:hypothetical protein